MSRADSLYTTNGIDRQRRNAGWARALWLGLLLFHVPLLVGSFGRALDVGGAAEIIRVAAVGLSVVFFVLKLADVAWLRLSPGRRSWIAATVCVLLLHTDVIRRNHTLLLDQAADPMLVAMTAAGLVATLASLIRLAQRRFDTRRLRRLQAAAHATLRTIAAACVSAFLPARFQRLERACPVHRAPPA